jgi:hypothetical protein
MESREEFKARTELQDRLRREAFAWGYLCGLSDVRHNRVELGMGCVELRVVEAYAESDVPPSGLHALWAEHAYTPPAAGEVAA